MKVKELIKYLLTLDEEMEVLILEQLIIGMDGDVLTLDKNNMKITNIDELEKRNANILTYYVNDTEIIDNDDKFLLLNHKEKVYCETIELESIPEEEEEEEKIEIETIEI